MTNTVIDQAAREKIKYELGTNFLVEAGAGSGKTTSLVERMVELIRTGTCDVDQMVAITFTRKAADELKVRFQAKVEKSWKVEKDPDKNFRLASALQNMERCFIGTVHSFCAKLLRERPIEAELDLAFTELEGQDDLELLEEAWQVYLQTLQTEQSPLLGEMNKLGITVTELFTNLCELREYPDVEWINENVSKPELRSSYNMLMSVVKEAVPSIPEKEPEKGYDALQTAILTAIKKERFLDPANDKEIIAVFELFDKNLKPTLNRWHTKEDAKFYEEKIKEVVTQSIKPRLQEWREYCHPKIVAFLQKAMDVYNQFKKERSLLNFQDLLITTAQLLKNSAEVRQYFQAKYRCLLVDEFQDTDPIQAEIMFYLTSEDPMEKVWSRCQPKKGSLFVVGDPKQAIYRFRRADIDTYNRVKQLMEEHGGEVLQLTMNFRTVNSVTEELNKVFHHHLPEVETVYQAAYRPLHSFKKEAGDLEITGLRKLTIPSSVSKKDDIITYDAVQIAASIKQLLIQGYRPRDFMVLTRYNDGIATYAEKLEDIGVPVSISGEVVIGEMRPFQELSILLQTFLDPTDEVSLLATLRGSFFGISDDELYQWKVNGGWWSIYSEVPESLPSRLKTKFELVLTKLKLYQKWVMSYTPTVAIEKIIEDVGFYLLLLQYSGNKRTYKSLLQILEALRNQERVGQTTYKQAFQLLSEMIFEKTTVLNIEEDADAVRVMNIHKAKGLEARVVFLAHPAKFVDQESFLTRHIKRKEDASKGYFSFTVKKGFQRKDIAFPLNWAELKKEELAYLTAEELRILYVAATRPEQALVISSSAKGNKNNPWNLLLELPDIEEFPLEKMEEDKVEEAHEVITLEDYETHAEEKLLWLEERKEKSFDYWSPTKEKDYSNVVTIEREAGGGKDWGTIIHDVFEKVVQDQDVTNYIPTLLSKYAVPIEKKAEVYKAVEILKQSDFWKELLVAEQVLTEVPFMLEVNKYHPLYHFVSKSEAVSHPILVKGVIDLVYKIDNVWKIVDYKTDHPKEAEHYKDLRDFYQDQIHFYKNAWEFMTGEKVVSEKLFFVNERLV
jgi:ATP-dependent helicase/nuclease subunit A